MASGILRRTALFCQINDGIYNSGWRKCMTKIGVMVEPAPFSQIVFPSTDTYDQEFRDQIGHVDDLEWISYGDRNLLSGTLGGIQGSEDGWTHGGFPVLIDNPNT